MANLGSNVTLLVGKLRRAQDHLNKNSFEDKGIHWIYKGGHWNSSTRDSKIEYSKEYKLYKRFPAF